ncbi:MAG TPA: SUMF1/EgtB/PvdO family nonheme iron enzyme [Myxococcota bacterium]
MITGRGDASVFVDRALLEAQVLAGAGAPEDACAALDAVVHLDRARVMPELHKLLDGMAVEERGIAFRFVPGGTFAMGDDLREPDERPQHEVTLPGFWLSEAPLSWDDVMQVLGFPPAPERATREQIDALGDDVVRALAADWGFRGGDRIRLQYCENQTLHARDWHAHEQGSTWQQGDKIVTSQEIFGSPERHDKSSPYRYDQKPMIAVSFHVAEIVANRLSTTGRARYRVPSEAEWERAARGCWRGADYPWGDDEPDGARADFGHFKDFAIQPSRSHAPNDYGLFAMAGGVWEWCADHYDAGYYARSPKVSPLCVLSDDDVPARDRRRVVRGGSWADDADVLRCSFRAALSDDDGSSPNVGIRVARDTR